VATRIVENFAESIFLDDVSFDGQDRRVVYAMVDCHDGADDTKISDGAHRVFSGSRFSSLSSTGPPLTRQPFLKMTTNFFEIDRESLGLRI
jgi:hypothetical protein